MLVKRLPEGNPIESLQTIIIRQLLLLTPQKYLKRQNTLEQKIETL